MRKWLAWLVLAFYLCLAAVASAQPQVPPAPATSIYVQDYAGVLTGETKNRINSLGAQLASKTKAQVVVVTMKTLGGASLEEYSLTLLRQWSIGDKTLNNGVVMLVAVNDRQSRIEVGYGLEGALNDAKTGRIQDEYMIPYFQKGDYDKGILNGYLVLVSEAAKEYKVELKTDVAPSKVRAQSADTGSSWDSLPWWAKMLIAASIALLLLFDWIFLGGQITTLLLAMLFRRGGGGGGGGGGGFGGGSGGGGGSSRKW